MVQRKKEVAHGGSWIESRDKRDLKFYIDKYRGQVRLRDAKAAMLSFVGIVITHYRKN
jgi:hypothetical protein